MNPLIWQIPLLAVAGYLLGNFQTGVIIGKLFTQTDVRTVGSKSAGTTNVLRTLGWLPSVITLLGDVLKGYLAALLGSALLGIWGLRLCGLSCVIGHNWPALFGFKGGKGIASSLGVVLGFSPLIGLFLVICQAVVLAATHFMSVASICSCVLLSILTVCFYPGQWDYIAFSLVISLLGIFTHRGNLGRLRARGENKLDFKKIQRVNRRDKEQ